MQHTEWRTWRDRAKETIDLRDLVEQTHPFPQRSRDKICCPFHDEDTPSCHVYADRFYCYGCEASGDVFTWLERTQSMSAAEAIAEVARLTRLEPPGHAGTRPIRSQERRPRASGTYIAPLVDAAADAYQRSQSAEAAAVRAYVARRSLAGVADTLRFGVVDESVPLPDGLRRKFHGRLIVPTLDNDQAVWFKARYVGPLSDAELKELGMNKYEGPSGSIPAPYNPRGLDCVGRYGVLLVTEGELDAAAALAALSMAEDLDLPVIGLPGGRLPEGVAERIAALGAPVVLCMDADAGGATHAEKVKAILEGQGVSVAVAAPPEGHNDLNEALIGMGEEALDTALVDMMSGVLDAQQAARAVLCSDRQYVEVGRLEEIRARRERPHTLYATGIGALDTLLDGGVGEGLHIVGGVTGTGKTSLALHIAVTNALAGRPVLYATYEQSRFELWGRVVAKLTGIPQRAQKRGLYAFGGEEHPTEDMLRADAQWPRVLAASDHLRIIEAGDALSRTTSDWTLQTLATTAREIADYYGAPPLLIIDYLQRVPVPGDLRIREIRERVSYVAGALQVITRDIGCPVLALSSLSRAAYKLADADLEGKLAAFKEAGELEFTAHTAIVVYGVPVQDQAALTLTSSPLSVTRAVGLEIVKQRDGSTGRVATLWNPTRDGWDAGKPWPLAARG